MFLLSSWNTTFTCIVVVLTMVGFVSGRLRSDIVALCALLALLLGKVLTPAEALSGFSNPLILTLAGVFTVGGAVVRSGLAEAVSAKILSVAGSSQNLTYMLIMLLTAIVGSLVSNVGTVAIMMPITVSMARSLKVSPSWFLMPLAFMAGIGGMTTLIGNPANMVVNDLYIKAGYESLTLFSFLPVGLVTLAFGLLVLSPVTAYFLARRKNEQGEGADKGISLMELAEKYHLGQHVYKLSVPADSAMLGRSMLELGLTGKYGVVVQEIRRILGSHDHFSPSRDLQIVPDRNTVVRVGDLFYCQGSPDQVEAMAADFGLHFLGRLDGESDEEKYIFKTIGLCELVIMSASSLVNRTIAESSLREIFGISVLGIQRGNQYILENLKEQRLQAGDALLVQGPWENLGRLVHKSRNWVVVGRPQEQAARQLRREKIPFVSAVILCMFIAMASGLLPIVAVALLAALAMGAGGVFRNVNEAYSVINLEVIIMMACILPMAIAMEKSGISAAAAEWVIAAGQAHGPWVALALIYALASLLNVAISSTPVALLLTSAAIQTSVALDVSPLPFVFGVATSVAMCFSSPISTPANALVMSAGRYTFLDYLKIGMPLQIMLGVVMLIAIPLLFPF